jgi:tetratricopeptide (TPR) repeat protein
MGLTTDKYIFQALDAYPYNLEETIESLNYALSYDEKNAVALCLMGRIYAEQLGNYEMAKTYYERALSEDMHAVKIYPKYINVLLWNEDYAAAEKLIDFALTVKGTDKAVLYFKKAILFEKKKEYKIALSCLKTAKIHAYNSHFIHELAAEKKRIKDKMPKKKKKSSSKKKKKK